MEYLDEIPLKRPKESRTEFNFIEKIQKDLHYYQLQQINDNLELSKEENDDNDKNKKINSKKNKNFQIFSQIEHESLKTSQKDKEENAEDILSLCKYDIFSFARHGHYRELEKLFLEGISPDSKDKFGNTLLIIAVQNNNKRILKTCLRYGAQINMQNLMGNTALHFATQYGYNDIFEYLIKKGANPNIKNLRGIPAKYGLYNNYEEKLFLGIGLENKKNNNNNNNNNIDNKYKQYDNKMLNEIK